MNTNDPSDKTIKTQSQGEVNFEEVNTQQEYEVVNGVACPIDPQERLLCEGCQ